MNASRLSQNAIVLYFATNCLHPASLQASLPIFSHLAYLLRRILRHFQPSTIILSARLYPSKTRLSKGFLVYSVSPLVQSSIGTVYAY